MMQSINYMALVNFESSKEHQTESQRPKCKNNDDCWATSSCCTTWGDFKTIKINQAGGKSREGICSDASLCLTGLKYQTDYCDYGFECASRCCTQNMCSKPNQCALKCVKNSDCIDIDGCCYMNQCSQQMYCKSGNKILNDNCDNDRECATGFCDVHTNSTC